jgi:hypothetical protein
MPQVYTNYRRLSRANFRKIFFPIFYHLSHIDATIIPGHTIGRFVSDSRRGKNLTNQNLEMIVRGTLFCQTIQIFLITDPQADIPRLIVLISVI